MILRTLILAGTLLCGAVTPFTERTKTDFDTFLQLLNPYGHWVKQEAVWLYEPFDSYTPMTDGQWIYTDFGWYFQGKRPFSWATDHYGVWILGADNVWRWKPDGIWQASKVEWRGTPKMIGWRPTTFNRYGEMTESEANRYARPEEWIFLPREKLTKAFAASECVVGVVAKPLVEESEAINHTYTAWREIDRTGPDPYDVYGLAKSFLAEQTMTPKNGAVKNIGGGGEDAVPIIVAAPEPETPKGPLNPNDDKKLPIHPIMSLPTFYTEVKPSPAKPLDLYVYRPEIFQDGEGIQRRIDVWHNPPARKANMEKVTRVLERGTLVIDGKTPPPSSTASAPVTATVPTTATNAAPQTVTSSTPTTTGSSVLQRTKR